MEYVVIGVTSRVTEVPGGQDISRGEKDSRYLRQTPFLTTKQFTAAMFPAASFGPCSRPTNSGSVHRQAVRSTGPSPVLSVGPIFSTTRMDTSSVAAKRQAPQRRMNVECGVGNITEFEVIRDREVSYAENGEFSFAVMGDLHLDPRNDELYEEAKQQVLEALRGDGSCEEAAGGRIFQVGDLGGYSAQPGSQACFDRALSFLEGFGLPKQLVLGNHDLEGYDFDTDEENLAAWQQTFGQKHYWAVECGETVCIGLSTTRFRSAEFSCHEVYIDEQQVAWFEKTLAQYADRPVFVFTHAPPMGSGLKVLQEIHVKNRCAWLNHSENPARFIDICRNSPQIKLWFSGHFHLSHNYKDSISVVGNCAFVQVGVIGEDSSRDGFRHSRIVKGNASGYRLYTLDHDLDEVRLDMEFDYSSSGLPNPLPLPPPEEMTCHPEKGLICVENECELDSDHDKWFPAGPESLLAIQDNRIVEYDPSTQAPVGIVTMELNSRKVRLVDGNGDVIVSCCSDDIVDGADAVAVELVSETGEVERIERNRDGGFCRVFQINKWKKAREAQLAKEKALVSVS